MSARIVAYFRTTEVICLSGLLFLLPFNGMTTIKEILFFLLAGAFIADRIANRAKSPISPSPDSMLHALMAVSFCWALFGLVQAIDPAYSLEEVLTKMSKQYLLYFFAYYSLREFLPGKVKGLLYPLIFSAVLMSLYACYQFYLSPDFFVNRVHGFTGAFYRLSTFLVLALPVVTVLGFSFDGWLRRIILFSIPVSLAALFFTFTRGAWIAVMIELLILVFIFLKKYRMLILAAVLTVSLAGVVLSYKSVISPTLIKRGSEQPRIDAIVRSAEIIRSYPLTGIGYGKGTFEKYYPGIYVKHSHNLFLNTAVENGVPGLLLLLAMLGIIMKDFVRAVRTETILEKRLIISGIFASFAGFLCLNTFDYMYHGWPGQMFWMLIGIGYALIHPGFRTYWGES